MGTLALAAKITHVPSMLLSERDGPHHGCRQAAIDGHRAIAQRCRDAGVTTLVVFDVHWLVNSEYHVNCAAHFAGCYTSNELPHFIRDLDYAYDGDTALGQAIARAAVATGIRARAHHDTSLGLEYGTLVPMRYMNADRRFRVVSVAAWCQWHDLRESERFGAAVRAAIEDPAWPGTAAVLASGSLSHRFADNGTAQDFMHRVWDPFLEQTDRRVVELWTQGDFATFHAMLPMYATQCFGEGGMHDTAMLLGVLGGADYARPAQIVTPYFGSSGTGQINAIFPVDR
ncbi:MAG: 3,4-dihydroxyphenylacetate 2,3-dioxygenase [Burkholderiales bacterium]|jgi:3,4-dihydroxyphenylacetate 2,3-dioxygenase|nr:3,4-dihydroxyphenylacetate 2,3-dioxygenase [Burkholderiales bacterium]